MAFLCSSVTTLFAAYMTLNFLMKCSETTYMWCKTHFNSLNNWLATWSSMTLNIFPLLTLNHSTESIQQRWNQKDWLRPWWTAAFRWALIARKHFSSAAVYILNIYILFFSHWSLGWDRWLPFRCAYTGGGPRSWLRWAERHGHRKEEKASTGASLWHGERTTILPCTESSYLAVRIWGKRSSVFLWNKKCFMKWW